MAPTPQQSTDNTLGAPGGQATTSMALTANLICRVLFAVLGNLVCLVPMRILWRNGEFAATVFILAVFLLNTDTVVMALIWRDDNLDSWWAGHGLCDVHNYYFVALTCLYASSNMAIMRNLAQQVGLLRASPLSVKERRRRNLIQALIMFPVPIIQMAWVYPVSATRYLIGTLVGCAFRADTSWPTLVFFHLANPIFSVGSAYYAFLTYLRYRQVKKTTGVALNSSSMSNSMAASRAGRAQRKLYLMSLAILIPYLPMMLVFLALGLMDMFPLLPYDFDRIHYGNNPYPWSAILFVPSTEINFTYMNSVYIPIITVVPIFWFFGRSKEAMNMYRRCLIALGLGRFFVRLNEEYDPDRSARTGSGSRPWQSQPGSRGIKSVRHYKSSISTSTRVVSETSTSSRTGSQDLRSPSHATNMSFLATDSASANATSSTTVLPLHSPQTPRASGCDSDPIRIPHRSPFPSLHLNISFPFRLPSLPGLRAKKGSKNSPPQRDASAFNLDPITCVGPGTTTQRASSRRGRGDDQAFQSTAATSSAADARRFSLTPEPARVHTRVWSDEEPTLLDAEPAVAGHGIANTPLPVSVVVQTNIYSSSKTPSVDDHPAVRQ